MKIFLCCPRNKLWNPQTLFLDGVETEIVLQNFAQQMRCKNADVPDIYFTLPDTARFSRTRILNQNPKLNKEEAGFFMKTELQKLQGLFTQDGVAYGRLWTLVKASRLPVFKLRPFLNSQPSHAKHTPARRKIKTMKAFARFRK